MANFLRATEIAWDQSLAAVVGVQLGVYLMRMDPAKTPLIRTNDAMSCTDRGGPSLWNSPLGREPHDCFALQKAGHQLVHKLARLFGRQLWVRVMQDQLTKPLECLHLHDFTLHDLIDVGSKGLKRRQTRHQQRERQKQKNKKRQDVITTQLFARICIVDASKKEAGARRRSATGPFTPTNSYMGPIAKHITCC